MPPAPDPQTTLDRAALCAEMDQAKHDFRRRRRLAADATPTDPRRPSDGTRWTNQQLLFHMLFGYLIVRALLVLVLIFGLLPNEASKAFASLLDSARKPPLPGTRQFPAAPRRPAMLISTASAGPHASGPRPGRKRQVRRDHAHPANTPTARRCPGRAAPIAARPAAAPAARPADSPARRTS